MNFAICLVKPLQQVELLLWEERRLFQQQKPQQLLEEDEMEDLHRVEESLEDRKQSHFASKWRIVLQHVLVVVVVVSVFDFLVLKMDYLTVFQVVLMKVQSKRLMNPRKQRQRGKKEKEKLELILGRLVGGLRVSMEQQRESQKV